MKYFYITLFLLVAFAGQAQNEVSQDSLKNGNWFALPIAFFSPETNWAFGGAGIYNWQIKKPSQKNKPSQLQLGFAYTLEKQLLAYLPFQFNWKNNLYRAYGELGYYRYSYFFFGIGNQQIDTEGELYGVNFPRIRLNFLRQVKPDFYLGLQYVLDDYDISFIKAEGILDTETIGGKDGGRISGLGLVANFDTRDYIFNPTKGLYVEAALTPFQSWLASDFSYNKLRLDAAYYQKTIKNHVFAGNFLAEFNQGEPPFNHLALLGGNKKMRGYYEGRYRDKHLLLLQAEYRFPLFWRLGAVVFGGYGQVAPKVEAFQINQFKYTFGVGLRVLLLKEDRINLRFDIGIGQDIGTPEFYVTVGEAF